jgi:hypothetical protein
MVEMSGKEVIRLQQNYKCPKCSAEFPSQHALNQHLESEHMDAELQPPEQEDPAASAEFPGDETVEKSGGYEPEVPVPERR